MADGKRYYRCKGLTLALRWLVLVPKGQSEARGSENEIVQRGAVCAILASPTVMGIERPCAVVGVAVAIARFVRAGGGRQVAPLPPVASFKSLPTLASYCTRYLSNYQLLLCSMPSLGVACLHCVACRLLTFPFVDFSTVT